MQYTTAAMFTTCMHCNQVYSLAYGHMCNRAVPYNPPSLDTNPLFLALLKRIENLEQRINSLQLNPDLNKATSLTYG